MKRTLLLLIVSLLIYPVCAQAADSASSYRLATTTSWLEVCIQDLFGEEIDVLRISPPGTCPSHFDIQPSTFTALQDCDLLLYFDFQESLRDKLAAHSGTAPQTVSIASPSGMSIPSHYVEACKAVHEALVQRFPDEKERFDDRLAAIEFRMEALSEDIQKQLAETSFPRSSVIVSSHQRAFAQWLGFDVVDTFSGGDSASPRRIRGLIKVAKKHEIYFVIGNLQEGTQYASLLADEAKVPLIIFSNFPAMDGEENTFDSLVLHNLQELLSHSD